MNMSIDFWRIFISITHSLTSILVSDNQRSEWMNELMNFGKTKRTRFTIAKKVEILDLVKSGSVPRKKICKNYKIASSTLHTFPKNNSRRVWFELRHYKADDPQFSLPWAGTRSRQMVSDCQGTNNFLNRPLVQEKEEDFAASGGWLDRFKKPRKTVPSDKVNRDTCLKWS